MTTDCRAVAELLAEAVEQALSNDAQARLETHLAACDDCRQTLAALTAVRRAARALPPLVPPDRVWTSLHARLAPAPSAAPVSRQVRWSAGWLAAAATLALAVGGAVMTVAPRPVANPSADASLRWSDEVEAGYGEAIAQLEDLRRTSDAALDPELAGSIDASLATVDRAIAESRSALRTGGATDAVRDGLHEALADKVALLERAVQLLEDTRTGDEAAEDEAAAPQ